MPTPSPGRAEPQAERTAFERALLGLDRVAASAVAHEFCRHAGPLDFADQVVAPVLRRIGDDWEEGRLALSQVYMSGRICEELVEELLPPGSAARRTQPRIAIATLEDPHALGKRIVFAMLRAAGYEVADYGIGVHADALAARALEERIEILLVSTLMLRAALKVKDLVAALGGPARPVRVVVGGAPFLFDAGLWREVGADAMGRNAGEAIEIVGVLAGVRR